MAVLDVGRSSVTIGKQGYAEWREIDGSERINVSDAEAWYLYDKDVTLLTYGRKDATGVNAPERSLLVVLGDAGDVVEVRVRTSR